MRIENTSPVTRHQALSHTGPPQPCVRPPAGDKGSVPRLSSSWWAWWGAGGPGSRGDSCYGTRRTPAAAAEEVREDEVQVFILYDVFQSTQGQVKLSDWFPVNKYTPEQNNLI